MPARLIDDMKLEWPVGKYAQHGSYKRGDALQTLRVAQAAVKYHNTPVSDWFFCFRRTLDTLP